jgi:hypothetical protein
MSGVKKKSCICCDKKFVPRTTQKYCSKLCGERYRNRGRDDAHIKKLDKACIKICVTCKKEFRCGGSQVSVRLYCKKRCQEIFLHEKNRARKHKEAESETCRPCILCGKDIPKYQKTLSIYGNKKLTRNTTKCCSNACQSKLDHNNSMKTKKAFHVRHRKARELDPGDQYGEDRVCMGCGKTFKAIGTLVNQSSAISCPNSKKCREKARRVADMLKMRGYRTNPDAEKRTHFVILCRLRARVRGALKNNALGKTNKSASTKKLLGCTVSELKEIFTGMFTRGMTWKKFLAGEIHIDHILPCVSFDLRKKSEQARCFHYKNLQPLWARDNWKKRDKIAA